jgi:hypothetical protein
MQLENVQIDGLFGRFNYEIDLQRPEKITIIHAPRLLVMSDLRMKLFEPV